MTAVNKRFIEMRVTRPVTGVAVTDGFEAFTEFTIGNGINIEFQVDADRSAGPNAMTAAVYGLTEDRRYQLRKSPRVMVELRVGYTVDNMFTIFKGNLRSSSVQKEGTEIVTRLEAGDGEWAQDEWFAKSYGKGTRLITVLDDLVAAMGVDRGNLDVVESSGEGNGIPLVFVNGATFSGHATDQFARLMGGRGFEWCIQNNVVQVVRVGSAISDASAIPVLTPTTGLIGVPAINNQGVMTCDTIMIPRIRPGRLIDVESRFLGDKGNRPTSRIRFVVTKAAFTGSLYGPDFKIGVEGRKREAA